MPSCSACGQDYFGELRPLRIVFVSRQCDRRQQTDDGHDDHQFDQREAVVGCSLHSCSPAFRCGRMRPAACRVILAKQESAPRLRASSLVGHWRRVARCGAGTEAVVFGADTDRPGRADPIDRSDGARSGARGRVDPAVGRERYLMTSCSIPLSRRTNAAGSSSWPPSASSAWSSSSCAQSASFAVVGLQPLHQRMVRVELEDRLAVGRLLAGRLQQPLEVPAHPRRRPPGRTASRSAAASPAPP